MKLLWEAVEKTQPGGVIPLWVRSSCMLTEKSLGDDSWEIELSLPRKRVLEPDEFWDVDQFGMRVVASLDPKTGKKLFTLWNDGPEVLIPILNAIVELSASHVEMKKVVNLSDLNKNDFEWREPRVPLANEDPP